MTVPIVPVRRLFKVVNGGTPSSDPVNWEGDVEWATPIDLGRHDGRVLRSTQRRLTSEGLRSGSAAVPAGSLIVSTRAPVGYVVETSGVTAFNQGCRGLVPTSNLSVTYYRYVLGALRPALQAAGQGSTFVELSSDSLAAFGVPSPPSASQRAIADHLDAETARIDALIGKKKRLAHLICERTRQHAAKVLGGGRVAALNTDRPSGPDEVRSLRLRRCFVSIAYGTGQATKPVGEVAVYGMANMDDHGRVGGEPTGYLDEVDSRLLLKPGDLLFNRTNSRERVGRVGLVGELPTPTTFASYLVRLHPSSLASADFLNHLLNCDEVLAIARAAALPSIGQANLNPSRYSEMRIPLPSLAEQHRLVMALDRNRSVADRAATALNQQLTLLAQHRQALITAAVTGELDSPGAA